MLRKLLLLLLIGFAFTEVNAQELFTVQENGCSSSYWEFTIGSDDGNGNATATVNAIATTWPDLTHANDADALNFRIEFSVPNDRWEYIFNNGSDNVVFIQETHAGGLIPSTGWVHNPDDNFCNPGNTLTLISQNDGVLPVTREEFSDIKIYPNPSTGFINISNLKENSRVIISNIAGQVVINVVVGMNDNRIDIQDLSQGFYFVELEGKKTIKLIKK